MDPVAGDPGRMRAAGEDYVAVAAAIALAAEDLRAIASEMDGGSAAVDEVEAKATRLADTIERAHGRYAVTGEALQTYAGALAHAQELSAAAHGQAVTALRAQDEALASITRWTRLAEGASDPVVRTRCLAFADDARADLVTADARLDRARADLRVAVAQRDGAMGAACAAIRGAMGQDDLHDTLWQDLGGGAQEVGLAVWNGVDEVAAGLAFLAVVLCWVPGLNVSVAALATVAGFAVLFRDSVNTAGGNGSTDELRASALGVLTFGVGRFAQEGIRLSVAAARGARGLRVNGVADDAVSTAAAAGSRSAGADVAGSAVARPVSASSAGVLRSSDLWRSMSPGAITRATWRDLRGGVDLVRAPGLYRPGAAGHVSRPVDTVRNPIREYRAEVATTWGDNRLAGVFSAAGNEAAARAVTATPDGMVGHGWVALSGAVQVVETAGGIVPLVGAVPTGVDADPGVAGAALRTGGRS